MPFSPFIPTDTVDSGTINAALTELDQSIDDIADGTTPQPSPDITSFVNSQHDHSNAANGGKIPITSLDPATSNALKQVRVNAAGTAFEFFTEGSSVLTTKGDLLTRTSSAEARVPVGSDDHVVVADSANTNGMKWEARDRHAVGSYTGNGTDNRTITLAADFTPAYVIVKGDAAVTAAARFGTAGDASQTATDVNAANMIQAFGAGTFQVGTDSRVNQNGVTYYYLAIGY